ncbi:insulin-like growth factor-binding protein 3 receptor isoform X1 [Alosa pseudoharengus]|uniref:insulin-like growth factor-binding protein 3 receptor isoform X1 n=1 Tax=Alosa pseudoharengus TaxID=34774 RepID=UPI003F893843
MSMGKWHPLSNLRSYLEHHPPAVIFFLCMLMLSLTFIGIGFYTQTHRVRNPDLSPDWNEFLETIANLNYCQSGNGSVEGELVPVPKGKDSGQPADSVAIEQRFLMVPLLFKGNLGGETPNILSTTLLGKQLDLKGAAEKEVFNMTLIFYPHTQTTDPKQDSLAPLTCFQLRAPAAMLPKSPSPPDCPVRQAVASDHFNTKVFPTGGNVPPSLRCLKLVFTPDERLTAFLSEEDQILVGKHLLFVSAALLVICGLLCLSASLPCSRSRRYHGNDLGLQKEPLLES